MNLFSISGRCGRLKYFLTVLVNTIIVFVAQSVLLMMGSSAAFIIYLAISLVVLWVNICVGAHRCHDLGHNGWWQLIPFYCLWMLFDEGDREANEYGIPA